MRLSSAISRFGTPALAFLQLTSPGFADTILNFEPLLLAPYDAAFVQNGSCPDGKILKVTGAIRGLDRRKACVFFDGQAGFNVHTIGQTPSQRSGGLENVKVVFERAIPRIPGKQLTAVLVSYPPAGRSPAHRHAKSAFIYAFVLSGAIRIGIGSERPVVYQAGQSFYEDPGAHHTVSENASETQPASFLAVFILDAKTVHLLCQTQ
jgi:quercetin dioxygenase-like cupin family protein